MQKKVNLFFKFCFLGGCFPRDVVNNSPFRGFVNCVDYIIGLLFESPVSILVFLLVSIC